MIAASPPGCNVQIAQNRAGILWVWLIRRMVLSANLITLHNFGRVSQVQLETV